MNFQFNSANRVICSLSLFSPCAFKCMVSMAVPQNSNFARKKNSEGKIAWKTIETRYVRCMFWAYERIRTQWGFMMWTNIKIVGYFSKVYHWKYAFIFSNYMIARARARKCLAWLPIACALVHIHSPSAYCAPTNCTMLHSNFVVVFLCASLCFLGDFATSMHMCILIAYKIIIRLYIFH